MQTARFEQFLIRARRTWTVWMVGEHAGVGLLCGCLCAVLLLPILIWRGEPGQSLAVICPLAGAVGGAVVGFRTRPGLRAVAELADRRFGTSDLLATALALRGSVDSWDASIVRMADSCAAGLLPGSLTPHRLGRRAWSGIFLSCIAAMTLGLLSGTMPSERVQAVVMPPSGGGADAWERIADQSDRSLAREEGAEREAKAEATPDSQSMPSTDGMSQGGLTAPRSDRFTREGQVGAGMGGGSGKTDAAAGAMPTFHTDSMRQGSADSGTIAKGGNGAEVRGGSGEGGTAGQVSAESADAVAPWSGTGWPAAAKAAIGAVDAGQIPGPYRDMVRDYFERSTGSKDARQ